MSEPNTTVSVIVPTASDQASISDNPIVSSSSTPNNESANNPNNESSSTPNNESESTHNIKSESTPNIESANNQNSNLEDDAETKSKQSPTLPEPEKHDAKWYAKSAYECFIKNADPDVSDADPIAAIQRVFNQRASDELKAQCAAEGKTAEGAYQFLWAVARLCKQTDGGCHISPETGYAIAMHYFQDVPADVLDEFEPAMKKQKAAREAAESKERAAKQAAEAKEKAKTKKPRSAKKAKASTTPKDGGTSAASESSVDASQTPHDAPAEKTATSAPNTDTTTVAPSDAASDASSRKGLQPAAEKKPSKPTPPPSAQTTLFDALFA